MDDFIVINGDLVPLNSDEARATIAAAQIKLPPIGEVLIFHVPGRRAPLMVYGDETQTKMEALAKCLAENNCTREQITILRGEEKLTAYRRFENGAANGWLTHH